MEKLNLENIISICLWKCTVEKKGGKQPVLEFFSQMRKGGKLWFIIDPCTLNRFHRKHGSREKLIPSCRKYIQFCLSQVVFQFRALPFGLTTEFYTEVVGVIVAYFSSL
jgi:hypothetical protein